MKTPATFKAADVKRAIKAVRDAGETIKAVEITREGTLRIITNGEPELEAREEFEF